MSERSELLKSFEAVTDTIHRLRAPGGCPWDREQTHQSLRRFLLEECAELADAIDALPFERPLKSDDSGVIEFAEELGDVFLQIGLHSEIAAETQAFSLKDVFDHLNAKLIRRHPHVFGESHVKDSEEVLVRWQEIKAQEQKSKGHAAKKTLDGIPSSMPVLSRAQKVIHKVSSKGFQWDSLEPVFGKVREELAELEAVAHAPHQTQERMHELGDLLFSVCNLASMMGIDAEAALNQNLARFKRRFQFVEEKVEDSGRNWEDFKLEELDAFWNTAKQREKT